MLLFSLSNLWVLEYSSKSKIMIPTHPRVNQIERSPTNIYFKPDSKSVERCASAHSFYYLQSNF